jgi:DNA-binding MarR family transcriptional regulator
VRTGVPESGPEPTDLDLSLLALFAGWAMAAEVERRLADDGFGDLRFADGTVFQHLIVGPISVTELGRRMGITQQAASKAVADLRRRGYVATHADPNDRRAAVVTLTERGGRAVEAARRLRERLQAELVDQFGARRVSTTRRTLGEIIESLGGDEAIRRRRVRPPG